MIALLSPRLLVAVAIAVLLAGTHWKSYVIGGKSVQAEWAADKLAQAEQTQAITAAALDKQNALTAEKETLRKAKNATIAKLDSDLAAALSSLHDRPARPSEGDLSGAATAGSSCTGRGLYKDDGEFLIRLAGRADKLRADLTECQAAYSSVRNAVK